MLMLKVEDRADWSNIMEHPGAQARTVLCTDRSVAAENEDHMAPWCTTSYNGGEWLSSGFVQLLKYTISPHYSQDSIYQN